MGIGGAMGKERRIEDRGSQTNSVCAFWVFLWANFEDEDEEENGQLVNEARAGSASCEHARPTSGGKAE